MRKSAQEASWACCEEYVFPGNGASVHHASSVSVLKRSLLAERLLGGWHGAVLYAPPGPTGDGGGLPAVNRAHSLTIANASASHYGQLVGLVWWSIGILLAILYFTLTYRLFWGRISAEDTHKQLGH
jgi:hypothetical protein